ncbi:MAG: hypothetical protein ACTSPK_00210 [Candidatus Heimdallarchaeota archaeon]
MCFYSQECAIEKGEHEKGMEICCDASRTCCVACMDESCPIKEEYAEFIKQQIDKINARTEELVNEGRN